MEVYSLYELNQYIKQVIALNFVDVIWISCEISSFSESRGHCYLDLVEKDDETDQVKAMMSAAIWYRDYMFIRKKLGLIADKILQNGMQVKLKVELDFHERYGLKLVIKDIDPSYTYGQLAIQREQIINKLNEEGRMHLNSGLEFPRIIQHCAVISSDTAAGYQDFINHLNDNNYNYAFRAQLFTAAMQGTRTEMEVVSQLREIDQSGKFQIAIITRGGGSKLDLSAFDSYAIAKQISEMSIPVITGIGHDIDLSIADMVSALSLKTPTAVANFLIDHNAAFESELYDIAIQIKLKVQNRFKQTDQFLNHFKNQAESSLKNILKNKMELVNRLKQDIPERAKLALKNKELQLDNWLKINQLLDPKKLLQKGYSITSVNGSVVDSAKSLKKGVTLTTQFKDGTIESEVL